jgi:hypothetical protein
LEDQLKKKILAVIIAVALLGVGLFQVIPALAEGSPALDHVQILPLGTTLGPGATQQFTAQGYDASNAAISNLNYFWLVVAGGGTINTSGLFTAGSVAGTYTNTVQVVAVQGAVTRLANTSITVSGTPGALDHVVATPANKNLAPGATVQFSAQGLDAHNAVIAGLAFNWSVINGGGTIDSTGLFTAGITQGTFAGTVQAAAAIDATKKGLASITIKTNAEADTSAKLDAQKFTSLFNGLGKIGFQNFLGGQWQIKNGSSVDTVKAIPGVVQGITQTSTGMSLTVLQNGQTSPATFNVPTNTNVLPKGTQLAVNDQVVVVTVNDQVNLVVKVTSGAASSITKSGSMPPGLKKQGDDNNRDGKNTPPGWSQGKKMGWNKD